MRLAGAGRASASRSRSASALARSRLSTPAHRAADLTASLGVIDEGANGSVDPAVTDRPTASVRAQTTTGGSVAPSASAVSSSPAARLVASVATGAPTRRADRTNSALVTLPAERDAARAIVSPSSTAKVARVTLRGPFAVTCDSRISQRSPRDLAMYAIVCSLHTMAPHYGSARIARFAIRNATYMHSPANSTFSALSGNALASHDAAMAPGNESNPISRPSRTTTLP